MASPASTQATIPNRLGLHARPAMAFVDLAAEYSAQVRVRRADSDEFVDGKSIMQVMMLAATKGTVLVIEAEGDDAETACEALRKLVDSGFGED
ncbi:MAG: HPr family phosphocarrier protein [Phycisphaeraceae bacterium]|nr:MAG: HPr family phosphocarrier protein [Phycisphaeraceae bacterium]